MCVSQVRQKEGVKRLHQACVQDEDCAVEEEGVQWEEAVVPKHKHPEDDLLRSIQWGGKELDRLTCTRPVFRKENPFPFATVPWTEARNHSLPTVADDVGTHPCMNIRRRMDAAIKHS